MEISEIREALCLAIEERKVVKFSYKWRNRVIEPYLVGMHKDEEELMVRSFQLRGESESGGIPDWRLFRLSQISSFEKTDETFEPRLQEYEPQDPELTKRLCWLGQGD